MTDKTFDRLLEKCAIAGNRYLELKKKCEDEYERRYGTNPSDADDDMWIDTIGLGGGHCRAITAKEVDNCATGYANLERINK